MLEFVQIGTICAIPGDAQSTETVHFVEIVGHKMNDSPIITLKDDWGQAISPGQRYYREKIPPSTLQKKRLAICT